MSPEQKEKMVASYKIYLDNNYPKGKSGSKADKERKEAERAMMVGAYAYATATQGDQAEPWIALCLMAGRLLTEEMERQA